ncbi:hypothetical protein BH20ACT15_BH20ACT15_13140 [soil metagenome]
MKSNGRKENRKQKAASGDDGPGSETERFRAIVDLRHNEAVTGESGVPRHQRDHELRRQLSSLDEFS